MCNFAFFLIESFFRKIIIHKSQLFQLTHKITTNSLFYYTSIYKTYIAFFLIICHMFNIFLFPFSFFMIVKNINLPPWNYYQPTLFTILCIHLILFSYANISHMQIVSLLKGICKYFNCKLKFNVGHRSSCWKTYKWDNQYTQCLKDLDQDMMSISLM